MTQINYSLSINEIHERYKNGSLTIETLLSDIRKQIEAYQDYNIWIHVLNDEELAPYLSKLSDKGVDDLPLYGIPFAIKDNIDLAHVPTTAACAEYSYIPEQSAFTVQLLIDVGAIPIGKTNLDQFATGLVGTRSPYGLVKNAFNPDYISGGSSSGSAVAVSLGQVSFSLGTDTAGSGRIPAAFNNLIGLKPTKGRVSTSGVVPACRSLDCVSLFALNPDDTATVFEIMDKYDSKDSYARDIKPNIVNETNESLKIGLPKTEQLQFFGNKDYEDLFNIFVNNISIEKYEIVRIDFSPFIEAAKLLYQGPWIAERYAAIEDIVENNPDKLFPVTREIISPAKSINAVDVFKSFYQLQEYKQQADKILKEVDFILTPTAGTHYRIDEVNNDPIQTNSNLGYYTNFMNLLDYSALAIPVSFNQDGLPFGVTLFAEAFNDEFLLKQVSTLLDNKMDNMGATGFSWEAKEVQTIESFEQTMIDVAVCGAHLSGMPLNHQLTERDATLIKACKTAESYRLYALAGGPPYRPGLIKAKENGAAIDVEVWRMPISKFGSFMLGIPHPLGIGKAVLDDGTEVNSFICEAFAISDAEDITNFGSWRSYIASLSDE